MSFRFSANGAIKADPPITSGELAGAAVNWTDTSPWYIRDSREDPLDVVIRTGDTEVNVHGRILVERLGYEITVIDGETSGYHVVDQIQDIVDAFPGHTWTGPIEAHGDEGWMARYVVRNGRAVQLKPTITWPED